MTEIVRALSIPLRRRPKSPQRTSCLAAVSPPPSKPSMRPPEEPRTSFRLTPRITAQALRFITETLGEASGPVLRKALERQAAEFVRLGTLEGRGARVFALLLADLDRQGWSAEARGGEVWVTPPRVTGEEGEPAARVKQRLRESLLAFRAEQLEDPAVRAFLRRMETPRVHMGRRVSILDLIDDGGALSEELAEIAMLPPSERAAALDRLIRPSVEVISADARCEATGLPLLDVWRYFRHTWSLEYRATPGRALFALIRNDARPSRPVMAIACLTNAPLQIRVRDRWIGWNAQGLVDRLASETASWSDERDALLETIQAARAQIRTDDLLKRVGKVEGAELEARLFAIAEVAASLRTAGLRDRAEREHRGEDLPPIKRELLAKDGGVDWRAASESPLFLRKRAQTLAKLLFAERILAAVPGDTPNMVARINESEDLRRALAIATREVRKVGLASRLLELNVCGAVPPYRELLVGKLAALAVSSAEVCHSYAARYQRQPSEIASRMAGRDVIRDASAYVITTTSLYAVAASQYNRLKVTVSTPRGVSELRWHDLQLTEGFGTTHLGDEVFRAMRDYSVTLRGGRNVNNIFGEGQSPRFRQAREALEDLGLDSNAILRHSSPRRVYGLELFGGAREALRLNQTIDIERPPFASIAAAWRDRWLVNRITNRDILRRIAEQGPLSVRAELTPPTPQLDLFPMLAAPLKLPTSNPPRMVAMRKESDIPLIQGLYRAANSCSEHLEGRDVHRLHIETPVDAFIQQRATAGGVVFVTGNPGDGKTFLLRRMESALQAAKVEICFDANEATEEELIGRIDHALARKGRKLVIAINEGILVTLLRAAEGKTWARAAEDQLLHRFVYRAPAPPRDPRVTVVDLNLRNNLAPAIVKRALERLLQLSAPCAGCVEARCDLQRAATRLAGPPKERVVSLLDAVAKTGCHATMRELQGFLSFLLFGGQSCDDFKHAAHSPRDYWTNAFSGGQGPLFDAVRAFDPQERTFPLLDDLLWRHADRPEHWTVPLAEVPANEEGLDVHAARFVARKRRALFENVQGESILSIGGAGVDKALQHILKGGRAAVSSTVRLLNRFYDRGEERGEVLHLWVTHRYDAQSCRYAAASATIPANELELLIPSLHPDLKDAFPDYHPDHAILCKKGAEESSGLRLDRPLVTALYAAEHGLPSAFRRGEPEARIAAFLDKLAKSNGDEYEEQVPVRLVDRDTGASLHISVDVAGRRYLG